MASETSNPPRPPGGVGLGLGRTHGTSAVTPFDRWFRYPAGFASDYVGPLLDGMGMRRDGTLIDPFAGSAVSGTAARARGLGYHGVEAHPLVAELGRLKLHSPGDPFEEGARLRPRRRGDLPQDAVLDPMAGDDAEVGAPGAASLPDAAASVCERAKEVLAAAGARLANGETALVLACFETSVLCDLVSLREVIGRDTSGWRPYLKWALLATLRDVASVKVGWPYQRPGRARRARYADPFARFRARVGQMADDLAGLPSSGTHVPTRTVVSGDSRAVSSWAALRGAPADGCLTSPPYMNNFDYADATRLELYFWTTVGTWGEMVDQVRGPMLTATTQQSSRVGAAAAMRLLEPWPDVLAECERLAALLASKRAERPRGKEYDQVLPAYLADMGQVLQRAAEVLRPGAPCVLLVGDSAPYGVYVDTPGLLAALGDGVGLDFQDDVVLRERGSRWTSSGRHQHALSERMVTLRRQ